MTLFSSTVATLGGSPPDGSMKRDPPTSMARAQALARMFGIVRRQLIVGWMTLFSSTITTVRWIATRWIDEA